MAVKRRKKQATALSKQSDDGAWKVLDTKIGGRAGLMEAAVASKNPKAAILADLLADPAFASSGTKALAKRAGLSAPEIVDLYRDKKLLEMTLTLHDNLPAVIQGVVDDAKPQFVPCPECRGTKHAENGDLCWMCRGTGELRRPGDKDKLKFFGDVVGITSKGEGISVNVNQQFNNAGNVALNSSFEELMKKAIAPVRKEIEGVVDVEPTAD